MPRKVIVVGIGGIGGWLARGLAPTLEYRDPGSLLLLVDGDDFEPKNRERQVFGEFGNKAEVLTAELQLLYPRTFIVPEPRWVVAEAPEENEECIGVDLLLQEMHAGDVVFAVVDNFAARKLVFDHARTLDDIDIFTAGNDDPLYFSTYHYQRRQGHDTTDHPADYHPELINPPDRNPGELSCQERAEIDGGIQTIAGNMGAAAWLLARFHETVMEVGGDLTVTESMVDMKVGAAQSSDRVAEVEVPVRQPS